MINYLFNNTLKFFDYFHKEKIIKKLRTINKKNRFKIVFDVGGHRGESIDLFLKNFKIDYLYSFEPSKESFKILFKKANLLKNKFDKVNIQLENLALGDSNKNVEFNYLKETSSSTIQKLNTNSSYFKKKEKYLGKLINKKIFIEQVNFQEYLMNKKINKIDLLKIDTEGYELEVLRGLKDSLSRVSVILFEHHYHNMILKNYTFSDIHHLLEKYSFIRVYKSKMPFRKTFEYIYKNKND